MAEVLGADANARAPFVHVSSQTHALKLANAIWGHKDPCADLAEGRSLFVDGYAHTAGNQRVRRKQTADSTTDDQDARLVVGHDLINPVLAPLSPACE